MAQKLVKCKSCGEMIATSAKMCPHCGAKRKRPVLGVILVVLGVLVIIGAISSGKGSSSNNRKEDNRLTQSQSSTPENKGTITMEEFESIKTGMSYEEVCEIIGSEGELLSEVDTGIGEEYHTVMYAWKGDAVGANANVTFQGGKVTAKAQFGLK